MYNEKIDKKHPKSFKILQKGNFLLHSFPTLFILFQIFYVYSVDFLWHLYLACWWKFDIWTLFEVTRGSNKAPYANLRKMQIFLPSRQRSVWNPPVLEAYTIFLNCWSFPLTQALSLHFLILPINELRGLPSLLPFRFKCLIYNILL